MPRFVLGAVCLRILLSKDSRSLVYKCSNLALCGVFSLHPLNVNYLPRVGGRVATIVVRASGRVHGPFYLRRRFYVKLFLHGVHRYGRFVSHVFLFKLVREVVIGSYLRNFFVFKARLFPIGFRFYHVIKVPTYRENGCHLSQVFRVFHQYVHRVFLTTYSVRVLPNFVVFVHLIACNALVRVDCHLNVFSVDTLFIVDGVANRHGRRHRHYGGGLVFVRSFFRICSSYASVLAAAALYTSAKGGSVATLRVSMAIFTFPPPYTAAAAPSVFNVYLRVA